MKVSNLVQTQTRKDSSFNVICVSTHSFNVRHATTVQVSRHPFLTYREELPWQLNLWNTCTDAIYLISPFWYMYY